MTTELLDVDELLPDQMEIQAAEKLSHALASQLAHGESPTVILAGGESDTREALPATAARLLVKILSEIAKGNAVTIVPLKPDLTTQEAAEPGRGGGGSGGGGGQVPLRRGRSKKQKA